MITAIEMLTDAYRLANILDQIQVPSAEQGVAGLRALNQLMADWEADGIRLGWHVVSSQSDVLPIDEADERAVKYALAVEFCGDYGIDPNPKVQQIATSTFARLSKSSAQEVVADLSGLPSEEGLAYQSWPIS